MNTEDIITDQQVKNFIKPRKIILIVVASLLVAAAIVFGCIHYVNQQEKQKHLEITQKSINELNAISEFCTANYLGEVMVHEKEGKKKELILIVRGKVRAGYDLTQMHASILSDTTICLELPHAKILDVITNPSDIRTFVEKGKWSMERVTDAKNSAQQKLLDLVTEDDLVTTAEQNGENQLKAIFSAFGFKDVQILYPNPQEIPNTQALVGDTATRVTIKKPTLSKK